MPRTLATLILCLASWLARAQAYPTASRLTDLQIGADVSAALNHNHLNSWRGYGGYASLDLRHHLGLAADFHQLSTPEGITYERTYEIGLRYRHPLGRRLLPYAKALAGRGVFNFAGTDPFTGNRTTVANLAFNTLSAGAGLDLKLLPRLNLRLLDCEVQRWNGFPPNGLHPIVLSIGAAYHFDGRLKAN